MNTDIAIVGMACVFPGAPDLASFWRNVREGVDAITDVPAARWEPLYFDPSSTAPDRVYVKRGGFIDELATFDAARFGVTPAAAKEAEPEHLLTLQVAADALADAGYADRDFDRSRASVLIGRGCLPGLRLTRMFDVTRGLQHVVSALRQLVPDVTEAELAAVRSQFQAQSGVHGVDTAIGVVPNLLASRVANRLDLNGSAYTLDAACASSLVAVDLACSELRARKTDLAVTGGVHVCHDITFWSVFAQLGALSRRQEIRPFDRAADGLLIGEGVGLVVLKRCDDARRDGDRIYGVIRGTATSSDGRDVALMAPSVEGQVRALERAWHDAGLDPASVGLLEAHGTGTTIGDAAELTTLTRVMGSANGSAPRVPIGSVKSMIGHAMAGAGAAGLIKAALAVWNAERPPTLHCDDPHPLLAGTRFRPLATAEPWEDETRRAAVNAFGFGGINAHVIVDAAEPRPRRASSRRSADVGAAPLIIAAESQRALLTALAERRAGGTGAWRLAVLDPTEQRIGSAASTVIANQPRHGRDGIFYAPGGLLAGGGKLAFLYPGIKASFATRVDDIAAHFGLPAPPLESPDLAHHARNLLEVNHFFHEVTRRVRLRPDMLAGHSAGEWSGMIAAGMFEEAALESFTPDMLRLEDVASVAAGTGVDRIATLIRDLPGVTISHDNCRHQSIVCGTDAALAPLLARLREARILHEVLPFRTGFHTAAMAVNRDYYLQKLAELTLRPPTVPLWSATTCTPYPAEDDAVRELYFEHLAKPVRFRELLLALYDAGARVFLQVGSGSLAGFVSDTLGDRPHHVVAMVAAQRPGMRQVQHAVAALYVEGADVDLAAAGFAPPRAAAAARSAPVRLDLGAPLIELALAARAGARAVAPEAPLPAGDPVEAEFAASLREIAASRQAVHDAFTAARAQAARIDQRSDRVELSLAAYPELADHMLIPQPRGWPVAADGYPAVPMTMSIELMMDAARKLDPARTAIAVEDVEATAWLYVEPACDVEIAAKRERDGRIRVRIGNFMEGVVTLAERHPPPPRPLAEPLRNGRAFPLEVGSLYTDGWLFHGPRYQGLRSVTEYGDNGMRGTIVALPARGALLDAAGQLFGMWVMTATEVDRLVMPVRMGRVEFFGSEPPAGTLVDCTVLVRSMQRPLVSADVELVVGGRVYARATAWQDWRFETGGGIYEMIVQPTLSQLATFDAFGCALLRDPGWRSSTADLVARRFLSQVEMEALGGLRKLVRDRDRLCGRIAAKDAVRRHLRARDGRARFPIEVTIAAEADGRPRIAPPAGLDLHVSIAHKDGFAGALVTEGVAGGIDIERIAPRDDDFLRMAFTAAELALLPEGERDEWIARLWAAKEAAAKAQGTGFAGRPQDFPVTAVDGERVRIGTRWVATRRAGEHIVASTLQ